MKIVATWTIGLVAALGVGIAVAASTVGDATAGRQAFAQCAGCHSLVPGQNSVGPSLAGVVGRPVGSAVGYDYSKALRSSKGRVWSAALLDAYLANPNAMYPGNKMGIAVANAKTRADIVAYLVKAKGR